MNDVTSQLLYFYNRHPISRDIILAKLQASRGHLITSARRNCLRTTRIIMVASRPRTNWRGKLRSAQERSSPTFAPVLAAPCVTLPTSTELMSLGLNSSAARPKDLTRRVGLQDVARIVEGNVMDVPLADASVDAVVSQELFCHVPDVKKAVMEASRILRTGGRLAFTDWVANQPLSAADVQLMWDGMAIEPLRSIPDYRRLVEGTRPQGAFGHRLDR